MSPRMKFPRRIPLAHLPTPIHKLERLSVEVGKSIHLWRDDMTGFVESGNKIRKLEFLLARALDEGATRIITAGGTQSNHTRATAFLARRLGLNVTVIAREPRQGRSPDEPPTGNLLLNHIAGAKLQFIPYSDYQAAGSTYRPFLEREGEASRGRGERPFLIAEGGSVPLGCFGYLLAVKEMLETWRATGPGSSAPDALFFAVGSGGTHAGLQLGCQLHGLPTTRLWGVNVCDSEEYFKRRIGGLLNDTCHEFNLDAPDRTLQILDGHFGAGYGVASDDDLRFYLHLARLEGVLLDPTYTGKAFLGMLAEIRKSPERFGQNILFLHSGGTFATFAQQDQFHRVLGRQ
jgi:D-cysteine desulfhydrase